MKRRTIAMGATALSLIALAAYLGIGERGPLVRTPLPDAANVDEDYVGSYYCGDGLGVNQVLDLKPDGRFSCSWHGCLGDYGHTSGAWGRKDQHLYFAIHEASGMFRTSPMQEMRIVVKNDRRFFLPKRFEDSVSKHGDDVIPIFSFEVVKPKDQGVTNR